ncbi:hypothetical protein [Pseudomonas sp. YL2]|uniref:hypothetical protein n=1 Tax=Pseudomonas sp. YL2 TaxID=2904251 RepID=UPI001FF3840E|nr:hypothetical protein [Pseudomonas sp. YL2]
MITKIRIRGYRIYKDFLLKPNPGVNILNPHWFNTDVVTEFLTLRRAGMKPALPQILIELYLQNTDELQGLLGAINADVPTNACPGVFLSISPTRSTRTNWMNG